VQDGATAVTDIDRLVFGVQIGDQWPRSLQEYKPSNL